MAEGDVRTDTFRASGPGGQHRNKTDSGVRLTHLPTGTVVTATESRSQHENRRVAWQRLRERLGDTLELRRAAVENAGRQAAFGQDRGFVWTAWRDEVKAGGRRTSMRRALAGHLDPLLRD